LALIRVTGKASFKDKKILGNKLHGAICAAIGLDESDPRQYSLELPENYAGEYHHYIVVMCDSTPERQAEKENMSKQILAAAKELAREINSALTAKVGVWLVLFDAAWSD